MLSKVKLEPANFIIIEGFGNATVQHDRADTREDTISQYENQTIAESENVSESLKRGSMRLNRFSKLFDVHRDELIVERGG